MGSRVFLTLQPHAKLNTKDQITSERSYSITGTGSSIAKAWKTNLCLWCLAVHTHVHFRACRRCLSRAPYALASKAKNMGTDSDESFQR